MDLKSNKRSAGRSYVEFCPRLEYSGHFYLPLHLVVCWLKSAKINHCDR